MHRQAWRKISTILLIMTSWLERKAHESRNRIVHATYIRGFMYTQNNHGMNM